jgi:uncharacterized membrane protein YkvA (DUF1232 family)
MPPFLSRVAPLLFDLPAQAKLAYCLFRDQRVPLRSKVVLVGALGLLLGPIDLPDWVPLGQMEAIPLVLLAVRVFNDTAPRAVVEEQRVALHERRSVFDKDWRTVVEAVRSGVEAARATLRGPEPAAPGGAAEPEGVKRP